MFSAFFSPRVLLGLFVALFVCACEVPQAPVRTTDAGQTDLTLTTPHGLSAKNCMSCHNVEALKLDPEINFDLKSTRVSSQLDQVQEEGRALPPRCRQCPLCCPCPGCIDG